MHTNLKKAGCLCKNLNRSYIHWKTNKHQHAFECSQGAQHWLVSVRATRRQNIGLLTESCIKSTICASLKNPKQCNKIVFTLNVNSQRIHAHLQWERYKCRAEFWYKEIYTLMLCSIMCSEAARFYSFGWNCIVLNIMTRPFL